ncbi:hypothetical protein FQA47_017714 [Oryzias melastigma]|uniref:Uncharacterized protein n=1 Tax=Oryzias melastigma TaxID=30732 RepID=A0A834L1Q9_ORYME|nr:hypothetical protein FQA47_017714 [Oryzias melastigma]
MTRRDIIFILNRVTLKTKRRDIMATGDSNLNCQDTKRKMSQTHLITSCTTPNVSSPIARGSMSSPEPRQLEHNRLSSANEFVPLLHQILTKLDMLTDQVKVIQLSLQKKAEETVAGKQNLEKDLLPLKDVVSLLTLERRLREETDLRNEMIYATASDNASFRISTI